MLFEMPYSGGVLTSCDLRPVKLLRYVNAIDYVLMAIEVVYMVFVIYYLIEEVLEVVTIFL
ncbi:unnamed protein product [Protopolystoma xenopodis]|uniref:Uncharacterized protein n=1 Tax=Protopolystoma xenopodis TaxID=117903 RepID=A0A448WNN5_9PLAT|nr:unnamed protein product [Protopolystoma xenopodis]